MATDSTAQFASALERADATCTRVSASDAADALDDAIEPPAVGVPLGIDGVSLDETVETTLTPRRLQAAETGVTRAAGVVEHGTLVLQSDAAGTEPASLYPRTHVAVVAASDLHATFPDAFAWLADEFDAGRDSAILATGPSATADMGELVQGVHGPQAVHVVVVEDR